MNITGGVSSFAAYFIFPSAQVTDCSPDMCQLFYSHGHGFFSYTDIERKLKKEKWRLIFWNVKMIQGLPLTEFRMN